MTTIYLISTSTYKDSVSLDFYATDDAGIIKAITAHVKEFGDTVLKSSFHIDYKNNIVTFKRIDFAQAPLDAYTCHYHLFTIPSI